LKPMLEAVHRGGTPIRTFRLALAAVAATLLIVGCASAPSSSGSQKDAGAAPAKSGSGPEYLIGPGDSLQIFVWRNPELSTLVPVRPDGRISTPLIEDMVAVGKSPSQLARDIEKGLEKYIRTPQVNVIVTTPRSANSQVRVVGQASNPRAVPYRDGMTVLDVVIEVGGLAQFAAGNRAKIVRTAPGGTSTELRVRLDDLINKGDLSQNIALQPGDVLIIPESRL
jgi:polysaccharide export outer membrane protein